MAVTAKMVKELREMTGAGMLDCKKALVETDGNIEKAVEHLREKGLSKAAKKAGRIAAEGIVDIKVDGDKAVVVEVNSETDFVAKNDLFKEYVAQVAEHIFNSQAMEVETLLTEKWQSETSKTVQEALNEKISVIGENLRIRRFERVQSDGAIGHYVHMGGKIGVLVEAKADATNAKVMEALKNVAMQIAAVSPIYISREEVADDYIENEKNILKTQAKNENPEKPDNIIEKMIIGRLNKQLKEVCLLDQQYVKDSDVTVDAYLKQVAKGIGSSIEIKRFVRYETGEGIEKKQENFAEEVAKQMR